MNQQITGPLPGELTSEEVTALVDFSACPEGTTHWSMVRDARGIATVWLQLGEGGTVRDLGTAPNFSIPIGDPTPHARSRQIVVRRPPSIILSPADEYARELRMRDAEQAAHALLEASVEAQEQAHKDTHQAGEPDRLWWSCSHCDANIAFVLELEVATKRMMVRCTKCKEIQEDLMIGLIVALEEGEEPPEGAVKL